MSNFKEYSEAATKVAKTTGQTPDVRGYLRVKIADAIDHFVTSAIDNALKIALFFLTVAFFYVGLFVPSVPADKVNIVLDAAKLCLGVFLGLFAGKKSK